jgi:hypothetical protein
MARFEDAVRWVIGGARARRRCWATVSKYTRSTPPVAYEQIWRIWWSDSTGSIMQGWGGQIGAELPPDDPIRDGSYYKPSDDDRVADDWEKLSP